MERIKEPNMKLMSPPGGKLDSDDAESPVQCAIREAFEECELKSTSNDWSLIGILTEKNFPKIGNIMIFLMEYKRPLNMLPPPCNEGSFQFVHPDDLMKFELPDTDKLFIWNEILEKRNGPFFLTLDCSEYPAIKKLEN